MALLILICGAAHSSDVNGATLHYRRTFGIVVGIDNYTKSVKLTGSANGANAMRALFVAMGKAQDGAKPYQALLMNQKIRRR